MRLVHRNGTAGAVVHALTVLAAAWAFVGAVAPAVVAGWTVAMMSITLVRAIACRRALRGDWDAESTERRLRAYHPLIVATGLGWGVGAWLLFVPGDPYRQTFLVLLICGIAMGTVTTVSANFVTLLYALLPAMPALAARLLLAGEPMSIATGVAVLLFTTILIFAGAHYERLLRASLEMRFELARKSAQLEADIVRRTHLEAELRAARQRAEEAVTAKSRFLARASHDLRQPLHAIGLFASSLAHRVRTPDARELIGGLQSSLHALRGMFDSLLDLSRLDADAIRPRLQPVELQALLEPLVSEHRVLAELKGLRLRAVPTQRWALSDPVLLGRVVRNLLSNAIRYTPRGQVLLGCRRRGDRVAIEVWDTGEGIAPEQVERIFDEFVQSEASDSGRGRGLGLGLAIVRRLGDLLGHPVTVRSRLGAGSVFSVSVPAAVPSCAAPELPAESVESRGGAGLRVVVIDDAAEVREAMASLLQSWGCSVIAVADVEKALGLLGGNESLPELILADWELEGGAIGLDAVARLRETASSAAAAIITGGAVPESALAEAGVLLLHKPVSPARLRALVCHVVAQRGKKDRQPG